MDEKKRIVLLKKKGCDYWDIPGGKLEYGEKLELALKREVKEETNIDIDRISPINFQEIFYSDNNGHWIAFNFFARKTGGKLQLCENQKHDNVKWFAIYDLPTNIEPWTRKAIDEFIRHMKL